jgi:hypothetical protein
MDEPTVRVVLDDATYGVAADAFSQKVLDRLVEDLASHHLIALDGGEPTVNLIYQLAFNLFAVIENHGPASADEATVAHLAFANRAVAPDRLIVSWTRTFLHGRLDDPAIQRAIDKARARREA